MNLADLKSPFPNDAVSWRAGALTRNKDKAMALAYIDARDVMDRLDDVCGANNWQDEYKETDKGRVICRIGILIGDQWVWKSDGAGDTDYEGEKGAISDAFKRAAVKWGIGRYLYALDAPWVPCETGNNGKWRKWTADPWRFVGNAKPPAAAPTEPPDESAPARDRILSGLKQTPDTIAEDVIRNSPNFLADYSKLSEPHKAQVDTALRNRKAAA